MRCLGQITERKAAEQFVAYLFVQGITTQVDPVANSMDQWEVWVRDEDRMAEAVGYLQEFVNNPTDPKYAAAIKQANATIMEKVKQRTAASKNVKQIRYRSTANSDRRVPPLTLTLIILSCIVSIFNNFGSPDPSNEIGQSIQRQMGFVSYPDYKRSNEDPLVNLKRGQLWRTITPIFIHLSPLHLFMNVIGMIVLGRVSERWLGTGKYAMLVLVAAILPNMLQALAPTALGGNPLFGGISGVVYALFGLVWVRSVINPTLGVYIPFVYLVMILLPLAIGFSGLVPGWRAADLCHLGGLMIGAAVAYMIEKR